MKAQQLENGMVGLGVMGRNLLLNLADHEHSATGYEKDGSKVAALRFGEVKVDTHCLDLTRNVNYSGKP